VIAFLAANAVGAQLGEMLPASAGSPEVRVLIGFIVVFVVTVAAATLVGVLVSKMFKAAGLSGVDRTLGGVFGLGRGIVILLAVAICSRNDRAAAPCAVEGVGGAPECSNAPCCNSSRGYLRRCRNA